MYLAEVVVRLIYVEASTIAVKFLGLRARIRGDWLRRSMHNLPSRLSTYIIIDRTRASVLPFTDE